MLLHPSRQLQWAAPCSKPDSLQQLPAALLANTRTAVQVQGWRKASAALLTPGVSVKAEGLQQLLQPYE